MSAVRPMRILSAGAPKTGVRACAEAFAETSGEQFEIEFATAPVIKERVSSGAANADLVVAPVAAMEGFAEADLLASDGAAPVGSVTMGVVVRDGAPEPDLSSVDTLVEALRRADAVVFNKASSGEHVAQMLEGLGLAEELAAKIVRVPTGAAVMEYLAGRPSSEAIGFGQITEIRLHEDLGTHLVGPLPEAIGKTTTYAVGPLAGAERAEAAEALAAFMTSADGKRIFNESGVI